MSITQLATGLGIDLIVIGLLAYGIYFRRHGKADLALAFVALNVGVFAAVALLADSELGMGFAFGLFGILSIIRLRSTQLSQSEVAYYFVSLVFGLIHSLGAAHLALVVAVDILLLVIMASLDNSRISSRMSEQRIILDRAISDSSVLKEEVEYRVGAEVTSLSVEQIDFVREITIVIAQVKADRNANAPRERTQGREPISHRAAEQRQADAYYSQM